jgi:ribosomal protein S18 acetylase RimI-like enzyme
MARRSTMETTTNDSDVVWTDDRTTVDWDELSALYLAAPLGHKPAEDLAVVFGNSRFVCFVRAAGRLIGAGRALADGIDCSYIADVAVHPDHQGRGIGRGIVLDLVRQSHGHKKVLLYASPGTEPFYDRLGFLPMRTAMARFRDADAAIASGLVTAPS